MLFISLLFISYTVTAPVDVVNDDVFRLVDILFNNYNVVGVCVVVGFDVVLVNVWSLSSSSSLHLLFFILLLFLFLIGVYIFHALGFYLIVDVFVTYVVLVVIYYHHYHAIV